jgi:FKBP-type peptidyl-prolyl cis-trans isomerase 2
MIKGFDSGVVGMAVGEEKTLTLSPEDAYGSPREDRVQTVPIEELSAVGITPVIGKKLTTSYGPGTITGVTNTSVTIDFNHELAGKTLIFDVQIVSIGGGNVSVEDDAKIDDAEATKVDTANKTEPGEGNRIAVIETSMGTITAELYETRAPSTTALAQT